MKYIVLILSLILAACQPVYANYLQAPIPRQHNAMPPVSVSVTTASTLGIAANPDRTSLVCTNNSTTLIAYVAFGANSAIIDGGIAIAPGVTWWMDDYMFTTAAVNVIGDGALTFSCQEYK